MTIEQLAYLDVNFRLLGRAVDDSRKRNRPAVTHENSSDSFVSCEKINTAASTQANGTALALLLD